MSARRTYTVPLPGREPLRLGERCLVMGILNVTPDSFADAEHLLDPAAALDAALRMEEHGADLIDIGGESTRPGAEPLSADEELHRVMPVLDRVVSRVRVPLSVDTSKARVAAEAIAAGVSIVNDVRGIRDDASLAGAVAAGGAALVLMHGRGGPDTMGALATYEDVVGDVARELQASIGRARSAGVPLSRVIVDPGIGFAKRPEHSYGVLARLPELSAALDRPILVGPSRKSFLREAVAGRPATGRDWGTAAAVTAAVLAGAHIVRVHAVEEMAQVVRVAEAVRRAK